MTKVLGFTGSRLFNPLRFPVQHIAFGVAIADFGLEFTEFHHGDCQGADVYFQRRIMEIYNGLDIKFVLHPPHTPSLRAYASKEFGPEHCYMVLPEKTYLDRNKDIVAACDHLLAIPIGPEISRSGTWSTIRHARRLRKPITIITDCGTITKENQ